MSSIRNWTEKRGELAGCPQRTTTLRVRETLREPGPGNLGVASLRASRADKPEVASSDFPEVQLLLQDQSRLLKDFVCVL